ncbi:LexA family transcriptional regulator [Enterobacteriaceae bacterium 89]|nr:LexA family transcriptional regulator [Enterobacteriaceae bacterium 89]
MEQAGQNRKLTSKQQHVFDVLVAYVNRNGYPPSRQELAGLLQFSSSNAADDHLKALDRKGYISLHPGKSRGITINANEPHHSAIQLLRELLNGEPGSRERAQAFLSGEGIPQ